MLRWLTLALAAVAVALTACTDADGGNEAVLPIEPILASEIAIEPDPSGTSATLRVATTVPVVCAVAYGTTPAFGLIATDDDMAGGAHDDHAPRLVGLAPDTEYQYVLQGSDAAGNLYRSDVMTFRTPAAEPAPGTNIALQGEVIEVSSEFSPAFAATNAIDGDPATEWSTAGDGDDASLTIDLGRPATIAGVRLRTREMSDGSAIIQRYTVTVDDGEELGPFPAGEVVLLEVAGRRLRFDAAETTGGNTGAVEIEVYEGGNG